MAGKCTGAKPAWEITLKPTNSQDSEPHHADSYPASHITPLGQRELEVSEHLFNNNKGSMKAVIGALSLDI